MNGDWDLTPDISRKQRLGFDETIFCASKTPDQINRLLEAALRAEEPLLLTRLDSEKFPQLSSELSERLDYDEVSHTAILGHVPVPEDAPRVAIVSAGSSDVRVAREAARTLQYYRVGVREIYDVGVAGLWRLLERVERAARHEHRDHRSGDGGHTAQRRGRPRPGSGDRRTGSDRLWRSGEWHHRAQQRAGQLRTGSGRGQCRQRLRRGLCGFAYVECHATRLWAR